MYNVYRAQNKDFNRRVLALSYFLPGEEAIVARKATKLEKEFEAKFVERLEEEFPGCMIIKGNSTFRQGVPDRLLLHEDHWAFLEFKREENSDRQENQDYYIEKFNDMSYAAFVDPDNADEVIREIQSAFRD